MHRTLRDTRYLLPRLACTRWVATGTGATRVAEASDIRNTKYERFIGTNC